MAQNQEMLETSGFNPLMRQLYEAETVAGNPAFQGDYFGRLAEAITACRKVGFKFHRLDVKLEKNEARAQDFEVLYASARTTNPRLPELKFVGPKVAAKLLDDEQQAARQKANTAVASSSPFDVLKKLQAQA